MAQSAQAKESARFMLGIIYERQKKFDLAEEQFRKVLDANPDNAAVLNYYGYMLADRGVRLDEATSMIQRAVNAEPNNGAYLDSLGWAYYKQDKLPEAEEYLQKGHRPRGQRSHHPQPSRRRLPEDWARTSAPRELFERSAGRMAEGRARRVRSRQGRRDRGQAPESEEAAGAEILASSRQTAVSSRACPLRKIPRKRNRCACARSRKSICACTSWASAPTAITSCARSFRPSPCTTR